MKIFSFLRENSPALAVALFGGILLLFIPIVRDYHLETAMVVSVIMAIVSALVGHSERNTFGGKIGILYSFQATITLPVFFWALYNQCFSIEGILFQILIPGTTILFVLTLSRLLKSVYDKANVWQLLLVILFIGTIPPIIALKNLPHLFLFNIIWGWFPGPIYDEVVTINWALVWHRIFVLLCSVMLFTFSLKPSTSKRHYATKAIIILLTIFHVYKWNDIGIIQTTSHIESTLGGRVESDHFVLIYDEKVVAAEELIYWLFWHEFHYSDLKSALSIDSVDTKIISYLYTDGWQKQHHTGARMTSYVPVWNRKNQLHIDRQTGAAVLRHELVHVLMKPYANPLIGASYKIGLTEGIAVAHDDPRDKRMTNAEVIVNASFDPDFKYINRLFSLLGFYSGRPAVNYAVSGSFIEFMLHNEYIEEFKCAYRKNSISSCLGTRYESLFKEWKAHLNSIPVDPAYQLFATALFNRESLFEKKCARIPTETEIQYNRYLKHITRGAEPEALLVLKDLLTVHPESVNLRNAFTYLSIRQGHYHELYMHSELDAVELHESLVLRLADSLLLGGDRDAANKKVYQYVSRLSDDSSDRSLSLRGISQDQDSLSIDYVKWAQFLEIYYNYDAVDDDDIRRLSADHLNIWLDVVKSQPRVDMHALFMATANIAYDQLSRDNLMFIVDFMIPYELNAEMVSLAPQRNYRTEIIHQIHSLSASLIHEEQVKLLQRASLAYRP